MEESKNQFQHLANCEVCPLRGRPSLTQAVPTDHRPIVVISQAPIIADTLANDAFDSRGGQLVKRTLAAMGYSPEDWMGTYSVLGVPKGNATPTMVEMNACRGRLIAQVKSVKPKVVMVLGETSLRGLARTKAGSSKVSRGRPFWSPELNAHVIVSHHPRYAMEQPSAFHEFAADFKKIPDVMTWEPGQQVEKLDIKYHVISDEDKAIQAIEYMEKLKYIYTDIETKGFNFKTDLILCQGFAWSRDTAVIFDKNIMHSEKVRPYLKRYMEDEEVKFGWHNGKFDIKFFRWQHDIMAKIDEDSMLKHYVINERRGTHDLEQVAVEYAYVDRWEHELDKYKKMPDFVDYEDIPKDVLHRYLAYDVCYGFAADEELNKRLDEDRKQGRDVDLLYYDLLIAGANAYATVEMHGMYADREYTEDLKEYFEPLLDSYLEELNQTALDAGFEVQEYCEWWTNQAMKNWQTKGRRQGKKPPNPTKPPQPRKGRIFNPNSHQQLKYVMYHLYKLPLYKRREMTGNKDARAYYMETTNDPAVHKFMKTLDNFKKDSKAYSTYVLGLDKLVWDIDEKIHSTFNLHGTETGRLSSSDPNVHNIPRSSQIKNIFTTEPDDEYTEELGEWVIAQSDYSQAELRVLAALGGAPWLRQVYVDDKDLHDEVSIEMYGPDFTEDQRVRAKAVNFGIPYGRTEFTLASEFGMPIKEARAMIADWFRPQPETQEFMNTRRSEPLQGITYTSPTGRRRFYGIITEVNKRAIMNEAGNFPIQGPASDCTLWSTIEIVKKTEAMAIERDGKTIPVAKVINSVHDSIITLVRANYLDEVIQMKEEIMLEAPRVLLKTDIPFKVDFEIGYRWGDIAEYDYKEGLVEVRGKDHSKHIVPTDVFRKFRGDAEQIIANI